MNHFCYLNLMHFLWLICGYNALFLFHMEKRHHVQERLDLDQCGGNLVI